LPAAGLLLLLLACAGVRAQDGYRPLVETRSRDALRGVEAVRVLVETTPFAAQHGLSAERVAAAATERLRAAGLRVLTDEEAGAKRVPVFFVRIMLFEAPCAYTYSVDVQLRETVRLARAPESETTAATWQNGGHALTAPRDERRVFEGTQSFLDYFAREYAAANGRRE
jgi:hypothetical protein